MARYWDDVTTLAKTLAYVVKKYDQDGLNLAFESSPSDMHNHYNTKITGTNSIVVLPVYPEIACYRDAPILEYPWPTVGESCPGIWCILTKTAHSLRRISWMAYVWNIGARMLGRRIGAVEESEVKVRRNAQLM